MYNNVTRKPERHNVRSRNVFLWWYNNMFLTNAENYHKSYFFQPFYDFQAKAFTLVQISTIKRTKILPKRFGIPMIA